MRVGRAWVRLACVGLLVTHAVGGRRGGGDRILFPNPVLDLDGLSTCAVAGRFDGDRTTDLAVCDNREHGGVTIFLGDGDGGFRRQERLDLEPWVDWLFGERWAPGRTSVLIAVNSGGVHLLRPRGDGRFSTPVATWFGDGSAGQPAVADFDADGLPDLAVPLVPQGEVVLMQGRADGTFERVGPVVRAVKPMSAAAGDFDGDGRTDLAVFDAGRHALLVAARETGGGFAPPVAYFIEHPGYNMDASVPRHDMAVADLDGNGRDDVVLTHPDVGVITVHMRNETGALAVTEVDRVRGSPGSPVIADLNGDRILDAAFANYGFEALTVLLGRGDGRFKAGPVQEVGAGPSALVVARFDRDRAPDLAVACRDRGARSVHVLLGNGDGSFGRAIVPVRSGGPARVSSSGPFVLGRVNSDPFPDLLYADAGAGKIHLMLGDGDGRFRAGDTYDVGPNVTAMILGRFNGDPHPDLAVSVRNWDPGADGAIICGIGLPPTPPPPLGDVVLFAGRGDGRFEPVSRVQVGYDPSALRSADFDGDDLDDLVVINDGNPRANAPADLSLLQSGAGGFQAERRFGPGVTPGALAIAAFDGDSHPVLAVAGRSPLVRMGLLGRAPYPDARAGHDLAGLVLLRAAEGGRFEAPRWIDPALDASCLAAADFNRDGVPDLAAADPGRPGFTASVSGRILIYIGDGKGGFSIPREVPLEGSRWIEPVDFDADGDNDLAVLQYSGEIALLRGRGDGTFESPIRFYPGGLAERLAIADLGGDDRADLVAGVPGGLAVLLQRSRGDAGAPPIGSRSGR